MSDEAAAQVVGLYQRNAVHFDAERPRSLFERPRLDRFRALLPDGGAVLDIGCGMGEPIARYLIEAGHAVSGIDSSPGMIARCRVRFPEHDWTVADMRGLALGRRFDGLIAWDSFFHLTQADQRAMFPVFAAHANPGAALMFTSGPRHGTAMGEYHGEPLFHASLAPDEYRTLLEANGFSVVAYVAEDQTCGGHTIWLVRKN